MRIFVVIPLYQSTKRHLNNSYTVKNDEKLDGELNQLAVFLFFCLVQCLEEPNAFIYVFQTHHTLVRSLQTFSDAPKSEPPPEQ